MFQRLYSWFSWQTVGKIYHTLIWWEWLTFVCLERAIDFGWWDTVIVLLFAIWIQRLFFSTKDFKKFDEDQDAYWQSWWMMRLDEGCILICLRMSQICNGWKLKWTQLWGRRNNGVTIASLLYQSSLDLQSVTRTFLMNSYYLGKWIFIS